ncbi:MAG: chemotaxis protein CheX [Spirochaetaceae bacterium]|jgi:chemotaxis protein CheX|nr:chemotaxis protein CheX [Spirochaetaceae bacterium]
MQQYIQPCVEECTRVFRDFIGVDITVMSPYVSDKKVPQTWGISSLMSLSGRQVQGVIAISMKQTVALQLTDMITRSSHPILDEDVMDTLGEILNIIAGRVKQRLEDSFNMILSIPVIILGMEHLVKWPTRRSQLLCIPFTILGRESFVLSIAIQKQVDTQ